MTWVRKDDHYPVNRKVAQLSDAAYRLDDEAICWSNRTLADGIVRAHELTQVRAKATKRIAAELVAAGRWHAAGTTCPSPKCPAAGPDGWVIHDYFDYQFTREKVLADRAVKAERQRKWMEARRQATSTASNAATDTATGATRERTTGPLSDDTTDAATDAAPAPTPVPAPAPKGKRGGDLPEAPGVRREATERPDAGEAEDRKPTASRPPPSNGEPTTAALAAIRATLAARSRFAGDQTRTDALATLRALTPDVPALVEPNPVVPAFVEPTTPPAEEPA